MTEAKKLEPQEVFEAAAGALSPEEALFVQRSLSTKKVKGVIEDLVPNETEAKVDCTVRFTGTLKRGKEHKRKPTSRALRKVTLALLVRRMGIQREAALKLLAEVLKEAQELPEDAEAKLLEEHPEVGEAFERLDEFIAGLEPVDAQGRVTLQHTHVELIGRNR
jgi:hypothetical protein